MSRSVAAPRPRICRTRVLPGSKKPISTFKETRRCWKAANGASPRFLPIGRFPTAQDKGFDHLKVGLSIGIQRMVRSDLASSGVMFSIDTETGFSDVVLINAAYGLGENVVQGTVNPDEYYVFKPTLKLGFRPILQKIVGTKEFKLVYDIGGGKMVKNVPVAADERLRVAITDEEILTLARWACLIEEHYSRERGQYTPMDMEWAKDGRTGELFVVQARPETVQSQKQFDTLEIYRLLEKGQPLVQGRSVGEKIAHGSVRIVR